MKISIIVYIVVHGQIIFIIVVSIIWFPISVIRRNFSQVSTIPRPYCITATIPEAATKRSLIDPSWILYWTFDAWTRVFQFVILIQGWNQAFFIQSLTKIDHKSMHLLNTFQLQRKLAELRLFCILFQFQWSNPPNRDTRQDWNFPI